MTTPLKFAAAAAAVGVLAIVVGVVPRTAGPAGPNAPASPSPAPSPMPLEGYAPNLAAGTYYQPIWEGPGQWTVTVPDGWEVFYSGLNKNVDGQSDLETIGGPGEVALSWEKPINIFNDPCHWQDSLADPQIGPTVDDLATALAERVGGDASEPTDVILGGYSATKVELLVPADLDVTTCDAGGYRDFLNPGESLTDSIATPGIGGRITELYILDIGGSRVVMRAAHRPDASDEDLAELEAMLASVRIDPPPTSTSPVPSPSVAG